MWVGALQQQSRAEPSILVRFIFRRSKEREIASDACSRVDYKIFAVGDAGLDPPDNLRPNNRKWGAAIEQL